MLIAITRRLKERPGKGRFFLGFYISIKNDLLEPKHVKAMGSAVWLYMWLIDKVMAINENGIGKAYNGRPVRFEEVNADLGMSRSTYSRWIEQLEYAKYINVIRTPYGSSFTVNKAHKMWGKRSRPNNAELFPADRSPENDASKVKKTRDTSKVKDLGLPKMTHQSPENDASNNNNSKTTYSSSSSAFAAIATELNTKAKPEDNQYILQVIGELLERHGTNELIAAATELKRDTWVQENKELPSEKLNYLFFTQTKNKDAQKKLTNSIKRVSDYITKAQERAEHEAAQLPNRTVIRRPFGGNNE